MKLFHVTGVENTGGFHEMFYASAQFEKLASGTVFLAFSVRPFIYSIHKISGKPGYYWFVSYPLG